MELAYMIGIYESGGHCPGKAEGINTTTKGLEDVIDIDDIKIFFDCTVLKAICIMHLC